MFSEKIKYMKLKENVCKEINLISVYNDKSEKMKGEGNHNYGKQFSYETKKKMSISIRSAKGVLNDEKIIIIRKLLYEGKTNTEIKDIMMVSRDIVSKIKNGKIVCNNEISEKKTRTTLQERNIKKRKINVSQILTVIDKIAQNIKPSIILNYFVKINPSTTITIDIIKNIKRSILENKLPFYESEVNPDIYLEYTNKILLFCKDSK